jgi:hypothetical protein
MTRIRIHSRPRFYSDPEEPDWVLDAFIGLEVDSELLLEEPAGLYPEGVYMVYAHTLMEAVRASNLGAYEFLRSSWDDVWSVAESSVILLVGVSREVCVPVEAVN